LVLQKFAGGFGEICCIRLQSEHSSTCSIMLAGYLFGLPFDHEDRGNMFLRNVVNFYRLHGVSSQKALLFILYVMFINRPRDSAIDIATGYGLDDRRVGV
jgi:hypothetical protein